MMRRDMIKTGLAVAAAMVMVTGCGSGATTEKAGASETTAAVQTEVVVDSKLTDEASVTLGTYKGLNHTIVKEEVTDGKVEAQIHSLAVKNPPKNKERAAKLGDTANIDYEGTIDGVAFSGGTAYADDLELGSNQFIDGFEEGVIGMMPGEEKDLNLTFPDDYYNEDLAGKDVVFHVKLNYVTNPEEITVDDELAKRVNYDENATLEQLRAETREKMEINAEVYYYMDSASELLGQVIANSEVTVDPDARKARIEEFEAQYSAQAGLYGMDYKSFLATFMNMTPEQAENDVETALKQEMVMTEILKAENIQATEEQKNMVARINGCDDAEQFAERYGEEQAEEIYGMYAGTYFLIEHAIQKENGN